MSCAQVNQYDHYLRGYQAAAIQTERLSALLNAGQSVILSAGAAASHCLETCLRLCCGVQLCQLAFIIKSL
jgi:ABC-type transport system involved in Fe-S cluster assembly fused permease/ATPase subunit